jgi:hypothetical protein
MMKPADAERLTGYHVGGISPFGQKKLVPTAIEEAALAEPLVYMNGGQRGLQAAADRLDPKDALDRAEGAVAADRLRSEKPDTILTAPNAPRNIVPAERQRLSRLAASISPQRV